MSDTISWVVDVNIKPGQLNAFKGLVDELVASTRNEPNTLTYEYFLSADDVNCHIYERYADSAAAMVHLGTFGQNFADRFLSMVDLNGIKVYGPVSEELQGAMGSMGAAFLGQFNGFAR